jgi:acetoin utilization protein AcuC
VRPRLIDATALPPYDLGRDHPFARDRQAALFDLLRRHRLFGPDDLLPSEPATRAELRLAHAEAYIDAVTALSQPRPDRDAMAAAWRFGLGSGDNPIAPNLHQSASAAVGATLACVRAVAGGQARAALNTAGGLHHAMPARASGFCIYNDLVAGVRLAQQVGRARVLYVDLDVHHGDGVQAAFWDDPTVLTYSIHESPESLFPGTGYAHEHGAGAGEGACVNVPLPAGTGDAGWLAALRETLPAAARAFRPDLIVSQHGCDPHFSDPLANLRVTTQAMAAGTQLVRDLADALCEGRWVATGGGGYRPHSVIPRAWSWLWCILADRTVPEQIDAGWRDEWRGRTGEQMPERWADPAI